MDATASGNYDLVSYSRAEGELHSGLIAVIRACQPDLSLLACSQVADAALESLRSSGVVLDKSLRTDGWTTQRGSGWQFGRRLRVP